MTVFLIGRHTNEGISTHILTKRMTKGITVGSTVTIISTHILTKRMTQSKHGSRKWQLNFNSHPHEEDDHHPLLSYTSQYHFNSHPHEEDDVEWKMDLKEQLFQLTSSRRGWLCKPFCKFHWLFISTHILTKRMTIVNFSNVSLWYISTHILTKRMTADNLKYGYERRFQLTSSRRGWRLQSISRSLHNLYFNSHPHEEDDLCSRNYRSRQYISTHILTKRMTKPPFDGLFAIPISTHILTKRMTASCQSFGGMESFQLTSSRRGWRRVDWRPVDHINFNSHPHEEDDNVLLAILLSPNLISTHILTKRMTTSTYWFHQ